MQRKLRSCLVWLFVAALGMNQGARANILGMPLALKSQIQRIKFEGPVLPPMAHVKFCMSYPSDCRSSRMLFRGGGVKLTMERYAELIEVNAEVNRSIEPMRNWRGVTAEEWIISPAFGDCNDYAVTKRHELMARGWPTRVLLLAEVVTGWGEHHLVLVVRTRSGDLVVDNLSGNVRPWSKTTYKWVRMQSPENANFWSKVAESAA
jgi:predicted transglutaminase-like cysteine proteinase